MFSTQTSSDYDHLMLMQKVEVFEQAIDSISGDDLAKVLWLKSPSSEVGYVYFNQTHINDVTHYQSKNIGCMVFWSQPCLLMLVCWLMFGDVSMRRCGLTVAPTTRDP